VKPSNVIVSPGMLAKLLDFGIAKGDGGAARLDPSAPTHSAAALTALRSIVGTVAYMSPEQRSRSAER
jgi:serine/threonine protein kinase